VLGEVPLGATNENDARQVLRKAIDAGRVVMGLESSLEKLPEADRRSNLVQLIRELGTDVVAAYRPDLIARVKSLDAGDDPGARALLSELREKEGKAEFNRLFDELFPQLSEAAKSPTDDETIAIIDKALKTRKLSPDAVQRVHMQRFRIFINGRNYPAAYQALDDALNASPHSELAKRIPVLKERAQKGEQAAKAAAAAAKKDDQKEKDPAAPVEPPPADPADSPRNSQLKKD
jgi:hypothetical protein